MAPAKRQISSEPSKSTQRPHKQSKSIGGQSELLSFPGNSQTAQDESSSSAILTDVPVSSQRAIPLKPGLIPENEEAEDDVDMERGYFSDDLNFWDSDAMEISSDEGDGEEWADDDDTLESDDSTEHGFPIPKMNVRSEELPPNKIEHETDDGEWLTSDGEDLPDEEIRTRALADPRSDRLSHFGRSTFGGIIRRYHKNSYPRRHETDAQIYDVEDFTRDTKAYYCLLRDDQGGLQLFNDGTVKDMSGRHVADVKVNDGVWVRSREKPHMPRLRRGLRRNTQESQQQTEEGLDEDLVLD